MEGKNNNREFELLVHKYLTHQGEKAEVDYVDALLNEGGDKSSEAQMISKLWDLAEEARPKQSFDSSAAFASFSATIALEKDAKVVSMGEKQSATLRSLEPSWKKYVSVAAVGLVLLVVGTIMMRSAGETYSTDAMAMMVSLPDGSDVQLAPDSRLKVTGDRSISFAGNGYFDITHIPSKPFTVTLDGGQVQVLGTSFTIMESDAVTFVALKEGSVKLSYGTESLMLVPGEEGVISADGLTKRAVTSTNAYSLDLGYLTFEETDLATVLSDFARHYNLDIKVSGNAVGCTLTAPQITTGDAAEAAKIIAAVLGADVVLNSDGFVLSGLDCGK